MGDFDDFFELKLVGFDVSKDVKCALKLIEDGRSPHQNHEPVLM
jgi:hypothetical protein